MKDFNDGISAIWTAGLAALPTAGKLYVWLADQAEADVAPTDSLAGTGLPSRTAGTAVKSVTGLTDAARILDIIAANGASLVWTEQGAGVQPKSVVVSTKDPSSDLTSANKLLFIVNINGGAAWNTTTLGPVILDALAFRDAYQGET